MEPIPDWHRLWDRLSRLQNDAFNRKENDAEDDFWEDKAEKFDKMVNERWEKPDASREFLVNLFQRNPGADLLDIGAGTGKWAVHTAPYAGKVTALEPSRAMRIVLREKIKRDRIPNIEVVNGTWPQDNIPAHDFVLASHSMYGIPDFRGFVEKMIRTARKGCIMVLRAPFADSLMGAASRKILGQPHDSPNFQIAYNALLSMDIFPDVIMEAVGGWPPWHHGTMAEALDEVKNRLGVGHTGEYDDYLSDLLGTHLTEENGKVVWPPGTRSALVFWETAS